MNLPKPSGPVLLTEAEAILVHDALIAAADGTHPTGNPVPFLEAADRIIVAAQTYRSAEVLSWAYAQASEIVKQQAEWSHRTFGPGTRTQGVLDHLRKEIAEAEKDPYDLSEWIDLAILAIDGAWRHAARIESGEAMLFSEDEIGRSDYAAVAQLVVDTYVGKLAKNFARTWPDWRTMPADKAIEHDRSGE